MNDPAKLLGLLGMARRAGRLAIGFDAAVAALKDGKSDTVLLASDGSPKTAKECRFHAGDAAVIRLPLSKTAFAAAIGAHKPVAVAAVCDGGFAAAIRPYGIDTKEDISL
ncbi:MAG: ribosomal L7Ae/L30e/S12e/Gadd45 family protein [Clostridia bacterium]|nr:ribosomal L7Ae/L30e/S12e/Gadd45 family protein [Clostridia bacterium]